MRKRLKSHAKDVLINKHRIRVYDKPGTLDRYTAVFLDTMIDIPGLPRSIMILGLSEDPTHPLGYSQHGEIECVGPHLGRIISFRSLPEKVRKVVIQDTRL